MGAYHSLLPTRLGLQQLQNLAFLITDHGLSPAPVHDDGSRERVSILIDLPERIALARRALDEVPRDPATEVLKDTLQLVRRGRRLCDLELERVARHRLVLCRVVRGLVLRGGLRGLRGRLLEEVLNPD